MYTYPAAASTSYGMKLRRTPLCNSAAKAATTCYNRVHYSAESRLSFLKVSEPGSAAFRTCVCNYNWTEPYLCKAFSLQSNVRIKDPSLSGLGEYPSQTGLRMPEKFRVAIASASGTMVPSVVNALLATPEKFLSWEVTALAQPASVAKDEYAHMAKSGVTVKSVEFGGPSGHAAVVELLRGMDVVIFCMTLMQLKEEMALVAKTSEAGVGRHVPSFFRTVLPTSRRYVG
ncbi:hypothetical protein EDB81DRAFT_857633 [Dactylonectria macrodidyma]|uniref:NmrA-like domain-containing protein n=1 Tax=Dactylonectria macrodidyma TaxID=307937 RepID=A0A9P9ERP8_9HYPO|nr:hypothetical protein EDB81DRAFT_857633 [Dactylonectria macrodidyma]